jgi:hypothetical protein
LLAGLGLAGLEALMPPLVKRAGASSSIAPPAAEMGAVICPFKLAVINDEITQDFEKACQIVSGDFGLHWIELRTLWNKNVTELNEKELQDAQKILEEHKLRVTDIASPLFKTDWPGAPRSSQSETRDQFHADFDAGAQDKLLERCVSLAKFLQDSLFRLLAAGRSEAIPRRNQRQAAAGCAALCQRPPHPPARKRDVLQHRNRRRIGCRVARDS